MPTSTARSAMVHGCAMRLCSNPRLFPTMGSRAPSEPPHLLFGQAGNVAPQGVDEQGLREFGKHGLAADSSRSCFFDQVQYGILKPVPGAIRSDVDLEDGRQSVQYRPAQVGIASHVPADEPRSVTAAASLQSTQVACLDLGSNPVVREWPYRPFPAAHMVRIPMGKDDDISGLKLDGLSIR